MKPNYRIYPSLLDAFERLCNTQEEFEAFYNEDAENGGYKVSFEELYAKNEQALLDSINRVPHDPIEPADRGTCFNEIIDALLEHRKSNREDVSIESKHDALGVRYIEAKMHDFVFNFDCAFCLGVASYFKGAIPQHKCEATIDTEYGEVQLYGYADEIRQDVVYDIKTTKSYEFGKYEKGWQRYVYPYCLIEAGELTEVREFEYTPVVLTGGTSRQPLITGTMYRERYDYDHEDARRKLKQGLERFIAWLELNREKITDKKIFNEE